MDATTPDAATPAAPPPPPALPEGWAGPAMAIQAVRGIPERILVSIVPTGAPPIVIDLRDLLYDWELPLDRFPPHPGPVEVGTHYLADDPRELSPRSKGIDPLLWLIGLHTFDGQRASWLRAGDKYRLKWMPDLAELIHSPEHAKVIRALTGGLATIEKLAARARVDAGVANDVVNALSLMNALRRLEGKGAAPSLPPRSAEFAPVAKIGRHSTRRGG